MYGSPYEPNGSGETTKTLAKASSRTYPAQSTPAPYLQQHQWVGAKMVSTLSGAGF
jgi:hypothetical protein